MGQTAGVELGSSKDAHKIKDTLDDAVCCEGFEPWRVTLWIALCMCAVRLHVNGYKWTIRA